MKMKSPHWFWLWCALVLVGMAFMPGKILKQDTPEKVCISLADHQLYKLICQYRQSMHLDSVPLSAALSKTALAHTLDLKLNQPDKKPCNLHSWSSKGAWDPCCYQGAGEGPCMWKKPFEIAGFSGDGFEIACWTSGVMTPETALNLWKHSPGHNAVVSNTGMWKEMKWKSMGVSVYGHYAAVWFSTVKDLLPVPQFCGK